MRQKQALFLQLLFSFLLVPPVLSPESYRERNPELGIVYSIGEWDRQQWNSILKDASPPFRWAMFPVGSGGCKAVAPSMIALMAKAGNHGLRVGLVIDPFVSEKDARGSIDCAVRNGVERVILDEYVSYQTKNLKRPICTVLSEVRSLYRYVKGKYPHVEVGIDDNWHTWIVDLGRGRSDKCGAYPYFQVDTAGASVLSKYGNPATVGSCAHPTVAEMEEQLIDLEPTVRDYSRSGKIFFWQLNQHWYPGGDDVLQLFRQSKAVHGWQRFFLWGPTADNIQANNWSYRAQARRDGCFQTGFHWFLPARDYLIRITEGLKTSLTIQPPGSTIVGSSVSIPGKIRAGSGIRGESVELQVVPPAGTVRSFRRELIAPPRARIVIVGVRVNTQMPHDIRGNAQFSLDRVQFFDRNSNNLVQNSDFNDGLNNWLLISTTPVSVASNGSENSVQAKCSPNQTISLSSFPIIVTPGRPYTVNFDAGIIQEARNNGYFYVSWNEIKEVHRDRIFMTFPNPQTVTSTRSQGDGSFSLDWQPTQRGTYTVRVFFRGSRLYQPSLVSVPVAVN